MSEKIKLVQQWMRRVWENQEVAAIDELFIPDGEAMGLGGQPLVGPKDFKGFHAAMCDLLKNYRIDLDHCIEQGDWISVLMTIKAQSQKNDQDITFTGQVLVKIQNGQIQQAYNHIDFMGLFTQLGLLPGDCFEQGLSGCRVN